MYYLLPLNLLTITSFLYIPIASLICYWYNKFVKPKMPHQCVKCSRIISIASKELLEGCADCGGHFFFYIREEQLNKIKEKPIDIPEQQKEKIEKDVREMAGITEETAPVILDLESVRVIKPGKFEIDLVSLLNRKPIVFKLQEGKYIIDLDSGMPHKE